MQVKYEMKHSLESYIFFLHTDMSIFYWFADFRVFGLVLGRSCESSRSGLIFSTVVGEGGGRSVKYKHQFLRFL